MALVKYNNNSISAVTAASSLPTGAMTLISTTTASSSSTISITSGIDSTYPIYLLKFINVHPSANGEKFQVNFRDGGSAYDAVKTTTAFEAYQNEAGSSAALTYQTTNDLAQSTSAQHISDGQGNENDESCCGQLFLFSPSSTTYVKHFLIEANMYNGGDFSVQDFVAGYCNTTSAIDGVQFSMTSGNIDAGTFKLYGIKDS
tara:strand:- start:6 stop:611 length:606 start_codon:yes stop_codon:yes gene_type:complete